MKSFFSLLSISLFCYTSSIGQDLLATKLISWDKKYPSEKIYIHTNQSVFSSGDTLWYKLYATSFGTLTTISKVAYLQLIDEKGKIVNENKILLKDGCGSGYLSIRSELPSGLYSLRSFTSWMMNFEEAYLFHKSIIISGHDENKTGSPNNPPATVRVNFFPEGGDLIDGINNKVAFKATDERGIPVYISGVIRDNEKQIVSFKSIHDGMGFFYLQPMPHHTYTAEILLPDSVKKYVQLPVSKSEGYSLSIRKVNNLNIEIGIINKARTAKPVDSITLIATQSSGKIVSYTKIELNKGRNIVNIPKKDFQTGVLRLTLFDSNNVPWAERVLFVNQHEIFSAKLYQDSVRLFPKSKCSFTLNLPDNKAMMPGGSYSISVIDAAMRNDYSENILSRLLLTSEMRGYVYSPNYYFQNEDDTTLEALDLVMLTNGWRRFEWKSILENEPLVLKYSPEHSLNLLGEIPHYDPADFAKKLPVSILIQNADHTKYMGYIDPDSSGRFILRDYNVFGNSVVYWNNAFIKKRKNPDIQVHFSSSSIDTLLTAPYIIPPWEIEKSRLVSAPATGNTSDSGATLKPVTLTSRISKSDLLAKEYVSPLFYNERVYDLDLLNNFYPNSIGIIDFMKGRFPGLVISGTNNNYRFSYRGSDLSGSGSGIKSLKNKDTHSRNGGGPDSNNNSLEDNSNAGGNSIPFFYLNEVLTPLESIVGIPLSDVALIRFNPPPFSIAPFNGGFLGAVSVYTKKGVDIPVNNKSLVTNSYSQYVFKGFTVSRNFFSPDYGPETNKENIKDKRTTLYWNADVLFDEKGSFHFSFYNSDSAKRFYIQLQGISSNGSFVYYEKEIY